MTHQPSPELQRAILDMNDTGNARRLAALVAGQLFWVEDLGSWVAHDGTRWSVQRGDAAAMAFAQMVADDIFVQARALRMATDEDIAALWGRNANKELATKLAGELYTWGVKTGNTDRLNGMLRAAKGLRDMGGSNTRPFVFLAELDDFDGDLLAYHAANGVIRFGKGRDGVWRHSFTPGHDPADMMMQVAEVAYDPDAVAPAWLERLAVMFPEEDRREMVRRIYGSTLTGWTDDQAFYVFQGKGQDGKSATNDIIGWMHGDYFRAAAPQTFLQGRERDPGAPQTDLVRLRGDIRMVVADEPPKRATWDGQRIKQVTGSRITARGYHGKTEITFVPRWKLIVECNGLPKAPSDDRGFRRRFKLAIFKVQFGITPGVPDEPVSDVKARLRAEAPGILNWMIGGALAWLNERCIPEPELSRRAAESFWSETSPLGDWIEWACVRDPEAETPSADLYASFKAFCINEKALKEDFVMTPTRFGTELNDRQIYGRKSHGRMIREGLRLKRPDERDGEGEAAPASGFDDEPVPGWGDGLSVLD